MGRLIDEYLDIKLQQKCVSKTIDILWKMTQDQKIEQILDDCDLEECEVLEKIKEVVEDGNNNNRIHEIIMWLSIMRNNLKDFPEVGSDNKIKALSETINIVHKYEKIEQILKDIPYGGDAIVRRIQEVVEDGNNTTNAGSN